MATSIVYRDVAEDITIIPTENWDDSDEPSFVLDVEDSKKEIA